MIDKKLSKVFVGVVCMVGLFLTQCQQEADPLVETQTPIATEQPTESIQETSVPTNTPEPIPTLTKEEQVAEDIIQTGGQMASSVGNCIKVLETEIWCGVISGAVQVSRPEWEALFPQAEFYVVQRDLYGGEEVTQRNLLVVEQNGQRLSTFPDQMFEQLLETNHIVITEDNQEQVARALALTRLPDYLENDIIFSNWQESDWSSLYNLPFNFAIDMWTETNGLELEWKFLFHEGKMLAARGFIMNDGIGDYINDAEISLSQGREELTYYRSIP